VLGRLLQKIEKTNYLHVSFIYSLNYIHFNMSSTYTPTAPPATNPSFIYNRQPVQLQRTPYKRPTGNQQTSLSNHSPVVLQTFVQTAVPLQLNMFGQPVFIPNKPSYVIYTYP
jgi:hypothetical protein